MVNLKDIYKPIEKELKDVERLIDTCLSKTDYDSISKVNRYVLESSGKRIRPALVILSAKAAGNHDPSSVGSSLLSNESFLIKVAAAMELIHTASLIHDDVIDESALRHNKPTVNSLWGGDVSIALGNYIYSLAFEMITECRNLDIIQCVSSAVRIMSEGELLQICERDNLELLKDLYIVIVKQKTAALFAASCRSGTLISNTQESIQSAMKEFGMNFGIAFQIIDDHLDIVGQEQKLGKTPGQDLGLGEITLPILNLLESVPENQREKLKKLLAFKNDRKALQSIKSLIFQSSAVDKTEKAVMTYVGSARERIGVLSDSPYKDSLLNLTDF